MSDWIVEVLPAAVGELEALPADLLARFLRLTELIEASGLPALREPDVKHLTGKLWEMRLKGRSGIARALYIAVVGRRVVVLRVFVKKTQKTPQHELALALARAKEVT